MIVIISIKLVVKKKHFNIKIKLIKKFVKCDIKNYELRCDLGILPKFLASKHCSASTLDYTVGSMKLSH